MNRNIEINIDKLILNGFAQGERYEIGIALEQELTRLFSEKENQRMFRENRKVDTISGGSFSASPGTKPDVIGRQIAGSVFNGIK